MPEREISLEDLEKDLEGLSGDPLRTPVGTASDAPKTPKQQFDPKPKTKKLKDRKPPVPRYDAKKDIAALTKRIEELEKQTKGKDTKFLRLLIDNIKKKKQSIFNTTFWDLVKAVEEEYFGEGE